jgi:LPXTG-motif cell wall-anchored protein
VKRLASGFLALALTVMPAVAFAEGNNTDTTPTSGNTTEQPATTNPDQTQNNGQTPGQGTTTPDQKQNTGQTPEQGTQPGSDNQNDGQTPNQGNGTQTGGNEQNSGQNSGTSDQKEDVEIVVHPALIPDEEEDGVYELGFLEAELKDVKNAEGTWTVEVNGQKHEFKDTIVGELIPLGKGNHFTVNIEFTGTANGKQVTAKKTVEIDVPVFDVTYKLENGKHAITGTIKDRKEVEGDWMVLVGNEDVVVDEKDAEGVKGNTYTAQFENLEPGEYMGGVIFMGDVDGVFMVLYNEVKFEVTSDGQGKVTQPSDKNKSPVLNPEQGKKIMKETKKGGELPKTATTYPTGAVAGLALLVGGLALLKLRRTA